MKHPLIMNLIQTGNLVVDIRVLHPSINKRVLTKYSFVDTLLLTISLCLLAKEIIKSKGIKI